MPGSTTSYPGAIDTDLDLDVPSGTTPVAFSDYLKKLGDAVSAIETELGVNPSDASADVAARIAAHLADAADAHAASAITNTAAGTISATTVQAAINELDTEKAIPSQIRQLIGPFVQDNVAANQTDVVLKLSATAGVYSEIPMVRAGSITGVVINISDVADVRTAGTITVEPTINGTKCGLQGVIDGTHTRTDDGTQAAATDAFVALDRIGVKLTTDAGWLPTTADVLVYVEIQTNG